MVVAYDWEVLVLAFKFCHVGKDDLIKTFSVGIYSFCVTCKLQFLHIISYSVALKIKKIS